MWYCYWATDLMWHVAITYTFFFFFAGLTDQIKSIKHIFKLFFLYVHLVVPEVFLLGSDEVPGLSLTQANSTRICSDLRDDSCLVNVAPSLLSTLITDDRFL